DISAPQINMAVAPTRAPTVSEVAVPIVMTPAAAPAAAAPAPVAVIIPPPKVAAPKTVTVARQKPAAKKAGAAGEPSPRVATKDPVVADALAREQLKSALK
ncbi:MAG: hypothetical protein ABIP39_02335, partial [Polyangiaceae bacterium]